MRGNICEPFNWGTGSATAHCLRFYDPWYSAYSISAPFLVYDIEIHIHM